MSALQIDSVTKTFGDVTAVDGLTLTVPSGSIYGFIGPNGAGKTTTLRMIMRIFHPDKGQIRVFGEEQSPAATDRIGYLPEERGLYKKMKVKELLSYYAQLKGFRKPEGEVKRWLERMGLGEWENKKVDTLSKGMSQKVQFIAAVVSKPELVILDEPFSGLDPVNLEVLRDAIVDLRANGTTVIFSTHDMAVAEKMCDSIFMICKGRKVLDGTLEQIQGQYGADTVRLRLDGDSRYLEELDGVAKVSDFGQMQEVRLKPDADPQQLLAHIVKNSRVQLFEVGRPSLQEIFVRIAGPAAQETDDE